MANEIQKGSFVSAISESRTWLMGLAMIFVMLFHQPYVIRFPFSFFHHYGYYGVDVFFFLSGFGIWFSLHNNKQGGVMSFYARRLWRIWPYCLVAGWIIFSITVAEQGNASSEFFLLSLTGTNLWYIRSILVFYLFAPLLYMGIQFLGSAGRSRLLAGMLLLIAADIFLDKSSEPFWSSSWLCKTSVHWAFIRFPVFVLGMLFAWLGVEGGKKRLDGWYWVAALLALAFVIAWRNNVSFTSNWIKHDDLYFPMAVAVPSICVLLAWSRRFVPGWAVKAVEWMGLYSLEIYLVHEFIYKQILRHTTKHPVLFFIAVAMSFLAAFCLRKGTNFLLAALFHRTQA